MVVNAVSDHFGVGFRGEAVPQTFQIGAHRLVILDDSVVHDREPSRDMCGCALSVVGRRESPNGMRNAHMSADRAASIASWRI